MHPPHAPRTATITANNNAFFMDMLLISHEFHPFVAAAASASHPEHRQVTCGGIGRQAHITFAGGISSDLPSGKKYHAKPPRRKDKKERGKQERRKEGKTGASSAVFLQGPSGSFPAQPVVGPAFMPGSPARYFVLSLRRARMSPVHGASRCRALAGTWWPLLTLDVSVKYQELTLSTGCIPMTCALQSPSPGENVIIG